MRNVVLGIAVWLIGCGGAEFSAAQLGGGGGDAAPPAPDAGAEVAPAEDAGQGAREDVVGHVVAADGGEAGQLAEAAADAETESTDVCTPPPATAWTCLPGVSIAPGNFCNTWPWGGLNGSSFATPSACAVCGNTCACIVANWSALCSDGGVACGACSRGYTCAEGSGRVTVSCL